MVQRKEIHQGAETKRLHQWESRGEAVGLQGASQALSL